MSAFTEAIRPATDACWNYLSHASWQAAVVGLLILAVISIGRRMSAPLRYGLLMVALVKFVLPPFAAMPFGVMSRFSPPIEADSTIEPSARRDSETSLHTVPMAEDRSNRTAPFQSSRNSQFVATQSPIASAAEPVLAATPPHPAQHLAAPLAPAPTSGMESVARPPLLEMSAEPQITPPPARGRDFTQIAVLAWVAGLGLVIVWLFHQGRRLRRALRASMPVETVVLQTRMRYWATRLGLKRVPELRQAKSGTVPFSCGLFAPKVVVPAMLFKQLSPDQMDVVLSHELAHHRRRDLWVNALQIVVFVFFWFHPVVWILNRAIRRIREDCCDDMLLANRLITPEDCCETLLAVARAQVARPSPVWGVSMGHPLGRRLTRLMDESQVRRFRLSRRGWLCLVVCGALLWPGLRLTAAVQNGNDFVRPTANAAQAKPQSPDVNTGAVNPESAAAMKSGPRTPRGWAAGKLEQHFPRMMRTSTHGDSSAPAAVEYTSSVIGFKGLGFDRMRRAKLVDPDGRPFDLYWATASIGSFRVSLYDSEFLGSRRDRVGAKRLIAVSAAGYGPAFFDLLEGAPLEKRRTFHLPKDDVPIRGRIISPTGQPLAGVKVTPRSLLYVETPDRKPLPLEDVAPIFEGEVRPRHVMRTGPEIASLLPSTTTDAAGRFEIRGIGRDRVVRLLISGQEVESHWMSVATRSAPVEIRNDTSTFRLFADYPEDPERSLWAGSLGFSTLWLGAESEVDEVIPASFMQTLRPSRPIIGVVLDDRSGKPISHVNVFCEPPRPKWLLNPKVAQPGGAATVVTTTNEQGEFQLSGVPKRTNVILAEPPESLPYFNRGVLCDTGGDGVEPVKLVIRLARGIPVRGRLLNEKGKPFAGRISYFPLGKNAIVGAYADSVSVGRTGGPMQPQYPETQAGADGRFWIPVLPGPGVLLADSHHEGSRRIHFDRPEDADFANFATSLIESDPTIVPTHLWPRSLNPYDAYKGIDVPADVESVQVDMQVNVGHAVEGRVVDPMGQPPAGVLAYGTSHDRLASDGRFDTRGLVPGKPRMLYFLQPEKGLGGFCRVEDGEAGPITVRLDPTGSVRGVLTDANGKPMARTRLYLAYAEADGVPRVIFPGGWRIPTDVEVERARWMGGAAPPVEHRWEVTDENGAFLVRGVIPDLAFQLFASTSQYSTDPLAVTRVLPNRHLDLGTLKLPVVR